MAIAPPDPATVTLDINASVQSRIVSSEPFHPTDITIETFHAVTNLDEYLTVTPGFAEVIWDWLEERRSNGFENYVQFEVRLANVTAVQMGAGAYPLPKGHRSAGLTGSEIVSDEYIETFLNMVVADMKQKARY